MQKKQRRENVRRKIKILDIYIREREGKRKRESGFCCHFTFENLVGEKRNILLSSSPILERLGDKWSVIL